jgi:hypothetical protein
VGFSSEVNSSVSFAATENTKKELGKLAELRKNPTRE